MAYTPGNVHDSKEFVCLLSNEAGQVYVDSAYANKDNDKKLGKDNDKILHSAYRNKSLTKQQKLQSKLYSSVRYSAI